MQHIAWQWGRYLVPQNVFLVIIIIIIIIILILSNTASRSVILQYDKTGSPSINLNIRHKIPIGLIIVTVALILWHCFQSNDDVYYSAICQGEGFIDLGNDRALSHRGGPGLTQEQKDAAVEYHNKLRKQEVASDMEMLVRYVTFPVLAHLYKTN